MKLNAIDAASSLDDLCLLSSNRLEVLKGDRKEHHSIRIFVSMINGVAASSGAPDMWNRSRSWITMRGGTMVKVRLVPIPPGVYLGELLDEVGVTQYRLA